MAAVQTRIPVQAARFALLAALVMLLQACAARPPEGPPPAAEPTAPPPPGAAASTLEGRLVVDAQEYPWSAIGRLNLAGQGFCNGVLIGAQQVLTQARCLYAAREGRWWLPQELHFIAAYQKDRFLADSGILAYTVAPGFNPSGGASLTNLANNWAVVLLRDSIGRRTGWLAMEWDSEDLQAAAAQGTAAYLRAGYRQDWAHAVSLHFGCGTDGGSLARLCEATPSELALPSFVLTEGELRVLGDHYLRSPAQGDKLARLAAATISDNRMGRAGTPSADSAVRRQPSKSVALLLQGLGYSTANGLEGAVAAYLRDRNLSGPRGADIALLTALVHSAQNGRRP